MTRGPSGRSEAGTTLIELLVAVAIMGIAFVTIIGGIGAAIIGADAQKQHAGAGVVLRTAAEAATYQPCATAATYDTTVLPTPPPGFAVSVSQVSQWNAVTNVFEPPPAPCTPSGVELIELTVTAPGPQAINQSVQIVKYQL